MSERRVPLLVASCDAYSDVWRPFFELFWRRWPDCPFQVYLGSNYQTFDHPRVTTLRTRADTSWASGLRSMLDQLDASHVILVLEDFFLKAAVNSSDVLAAVEVVLENRVDCLRLSPAPGPARPTHGPVRSMKLPISVLPQATPYRVSCQPAIWRIDTLKRYLIPGFSAWEFELLGTQLSEFRNDVFWASVHPLIDYDHAIEKGRWKPDGIRICDSAGIAVDTSRRPIFSAEELHAHYHRPSAENSASDTKNQAIRAFQTGRRSDGLKDVMRLIWQRPWWLQLYGIAAFGTLGPRPLQWLRRQQLRRRITHSLKRESLQQRKRVADFV